MPVWGWSCRVWNITIHTPFGTSPLSELKRSCWGARRRNTQASLSHDTLVQGHTAGAGPAADFIVTVKFHPLTLQSPLGGGPGRPQAVAHSSTVTPVPAGPLARAVRSVFFCRPNRAGRRFFELLLDISRLKLRGCSTHPPNVGSCIFRD
jgi:hypothetical protein